MGLSDELSKLDELRQRGVLTEDEFTRAKTRLLDAQPGAAPHPSGVPTSLNTLRRSRDDRWLAGVCGGLAQTTGVESWVWRLGVAVLSLFWGIGVLLYLLLWVFVPLE